MNEWVKGKVFFPIFISQSENWAFLPLSFWEISTKTQPQSFLNFAKQNKAKKKTKKKNRGRLYPTFCIIIFLI